LQHRHATDRKSNRCRCEKQPVDGHSGLLILGDVSEGKKGHDIFFRSGKKKGALICAPFSVDEDQQN
jgi:hypothetical protein